MRLLIHDFSGHPFQVQLSRSLASRGIEVLHVHCGSYTTGKGYLESADGLSVEELSMGRSFERYSPVRRLTQEAAYGARFIGLLRQFRPDVLVSCNDPLVAKTICGAWCRLTSVPWVFWLQDLYSIAMAGEVRQRAGAVGQALGSAFIRSERWLLHDADCVVAVTDDFLPTLRAWGVDGAKCWVIENWAPLEELPCCHHENGWKAEKGLAGRFIFLYSGTLGLKHNPEVLYRLAENFDGHAEVVVASEGHGAERLAELAARKPRPNLHLLPFQPYERLPEMLGAADVLVTLLEPSAGSFSVPSKVLTYLCAGRPILASVPGENLAARVINEAGAGIVAAPGDEKGLMDGASRLLRDSAFRQRMGGFGRRYAEEHFDIEAITDRFLEVVMAARNPGSATDLARV